MELNLEFKEFDLDLATRLARYYELIPEFGKNNILADAKHLVWKHYENPAGRSIVAIFSNKNDIDGAMIFQKNFRKIKYQSGLFFLATDFAISKNYRSLNLVLEFWKNCQKYFAINYPNAALIHSSNKKSEKIYSLYFNQSRKYVIKPSIFWPRKGSKTEEINSEELIDFSGHQYLEWRLNNKSSRKYVTIYSKDMVVICAIVQKIFGLRFIVILDFDSKFLEKNKLKFFFELIKICVKSFSLFPIFYLNIDLNSDKGDYRRHFKSFPELLSPYIFPIYIHNNQSLFNTNLRIKLISIDVI
jgi:hypothetical protein